MTETYAPDGVAGFQHDLECWCEKRLHLHAGISGGTPPIQRGLTVEDIVQRANDAGVDPRLVTRIAFFFLANPDIAHAYGLELR